jgi:hypothetical protein
MKTKRAAIVAAISAVLVTASGTVGFGVGRETAPTAPSMAAEGTADGAVARAAGGSTGSAGNGSGPAAGIAADRAASMPYPGPEFPGMAPYPGMASTADGLHAVGVAYRQTADPDAKPGQDLVAQAFQDAVKQAEELAAASKVTLGKLVAVSDVEQTQPFYRECVQPLSGVAEDKPAEATVTIEPAPAPECTPSYHLIAWVFVRYELA